MTLASGAFDQRNGFARLVDLQHPQAVALRELCLSETERFDGRRHLDWSRQWEYPYVLANLPDAGEKQRVLDAGSGWRFFAPMLARRGFEVMACDLDPRVGEKIRALAAQEKLALEFSREDLEALRYRSESFDFITCVSVLEHTPHPERVVAEFHRCLAPGGRLVLTFDVSVDGDRDVSVEGARRLMDLLAETFAGGRPFADPALLEPGALARSEGLLRTGWFRSRAPELLPWRRVSRAMLSQLRRGSLARPFFDLAVVGVVLEKR